MNGLHVAITGASSGLGEAMALEFSRAGARVTLVSRRREVLEALAARLSGPSHVAPADLLDARQSTGWIAEAEAALGPIDVLISNAGVMTLGPVATFDEAQAEAMLALNFLTPLRMFRKVLPAMLARRRGTLVNVTSMAAWVTLPGWLHQSASKTGSATFSEALRGELKGTGVDVLTIYPGMTDTPMTRTGMKRYGENPWVKLLPLGKPEAFARTVRRAIEGRKARAFYPWPYGLVRLFPRFARWISGVVTPKLQALPNDTSDPALRSSTR